MRKKKIKEFFTINKEIKFTQNTTFLQNNTSNNLTFENNKIQINSTRDMNPNFTVLYDISNPDEENFDIISQLISQNLNSEFKEKVCVSCLDSLNYLNYLKFDIKNIKKKLKEFVNNTGNVIEAKTLDNIKGLYNNNENKSNNEIPDSNSKINSDLNNNPTKATSKNFEMNYTLLKQDVVAQFSNFINQANFIKIDLYRIVNKMEILKRLQCNNYEENDFNYQSAMKGVNQLIETMQDAIRKQNININFVIIT
jgi:hypothetical protein